MLDAIQTSASGMIAVSERLGTTAQAVASLGTEPGNGTLPSAVQIDLSKSALNITEAKTSFGLNAAVFRTADEMSKRLVDMTV